MRATSAQSGPALVLRVGAGVLRGPSGGLRPRPDANGNFSWANGSRVYYANLTANSEPLAPVQGGLFKGLLGVAVSRLNNPTPERVQKSSWMRPNIVIRAAGTFALEDKEQIWADNAASSPYFGHVYTCNAEFRLRPALGCRSR